MKNKKPHFTCRNCEKRVRMIIVNNSEGKRYRCPNCLCEGLIKKRRKMNNFTQSNLQEQLYKKALEKWKKEVNQQQE